MNKKELMEKRAELFSKMETMTQSIQDEQRAFSEEENKEFDQLTKDIEAIDNTVASIERAAGLKKMETGAEPAGAETEKDEVRAFANFIRAGEVDGTNIAKADNGAVIPKSIANRIIDRVKDISPLFRDAAKYNVRGTVSIPYVNSTNDLLTVAYATEFTDLEAKSFQLLSVDLTDYLAGALAKVSLSLVNDTDINLVDFVVEKLAQSVAVFIDGEIIKGTSGKITGLSTATQVVTAAASSAITADEIIRLKNQLKSVYQTGAYFVMSPNTFTAVQLLKDGNERYLFNDNVVEGFSGTILGKPVYVTDQMDDIAESKNVIFYINPSQALAVKVVEESVQILREKYATAHALGVVQWLDMDAKIANQQAVAVLKTAGSVTPVSQLGV